MTVKIRYCDFEEELDADPYAPGLVRLRSFSCFLPLAPGDVVKVDDDVVVGVANLSPVHVVEAYFALDEHIDVVNEKIRTWGMATRVEKSSPATCLIATENPQWVEDVVRNDATVEMVETLRVPGQLFDWDEKVSEA